MSELNIPESWGETEFENAIIIEGGSQPPKSDFIHKPQKGYIRLIQIRDFRSDNHPAYIPLAKCKRFFTQDDIMIGRYGPPVFQVLRGKEGSYNVALMKAIPKENLDKEYMYWFLQNPKIYDDVNSVAQRSAGQTGVNLTFLNKYPVPIPPLKEQRRIVSKIVSCFKKIDETEANLKKVEILLEKYRESILNLAIRGRLVRQDPKDEPASRMLEIILKEKSKLIHEKKIKGDQSFAPVDIEDIPFDLPEGWAWARLGDIVTFKNGYAFKSNYYSQTKTPYILATPGHFYERGGFRNQKVKTKFYNGPIPEGFILKPGDMIVAMTEQAAGLLGSAAFIPNDGFEYLHNQRLAKIAPIGEVLLKSYVYLYFNSSYLRMKLAGSCSGSTVRHTSPDKILNNLFPIPPLNEQKRIVSIVELGITQIENVNVVVEKNLKILKKMKQAILQKAFEGRLVEQISSEGTGHELLAKISASKEICLYNEHEIKSERILKIKKVKSPAKKLVSLKGKKHGKK